MVSGGIASLYVLSEFNNLGLLIPYSLPVVADRLEAEAFRDPPQ